MVSKEVYQQYGKALELFLDRHRDDLNVAGILACGSYANGTLDKYSDLDVYVVLRESGYRERGTTQLNGVEVEYFINPVKQIEAYLAREEMMGGLPATAHMLVHSIIVHRNNSVIDELIAKAKNVLQKQVPEMSAFSKEMARYTLNDYRQDLADTASKEDLLTVGLISNHVLEYCRELFFRCRRVPAGKLKRQLQQIQAIDPGYAELVVAVLVATEYQERLGNIGRLLEYMEGMLGGKREQEWSLVSQCDY